MTTQQISWLERGLPGPTTFTMRVTVDQSDLDYGITTSGEECALALAIKRALFISEDEEGWRLHQVDGLFVTLGYYPRAQVLPVLIRGMLPPDAQQFASGFDARKVITKQADWPELTVPLTFSITFDEAGGRDA